MSMKEQLHKVVENTVKKNDDEAYKAFSAYINEKAASVLKKINEDKSPIKLKGNDVFVNAKKVGTIKHDANADDGIEYTSNDGKTSKFNELKDLYSHLGKECKLNESKKEKTYALYVGKKGSGKLGIEFSGTREEVYAERADWKDHEENKGYVYKIIGYDDIDSAPEQVNESVKDYEDDIKKMPNHGPKLKKEKAYCDDNGEGLDADGDHDGTLDGKQADEKSKKPIKKLIDKIAAKKD